MSSRPVVYIHRLEWVPAEWYMNQANYDLLRSFADVRDDGALADKPSTDYLVGKLRGAHAILSLNGSRADEITTDIIKAAGSTVKVAAVSHWWGDAGPKQWRAAGVHVIDASDACNQAVAEYAVGAAIAGLRKFDVYDRMMKTGTKWPTWQGMAGQLNGSTVGLVGVGRVGRWVLRYLKPFDVKILVCDPAITPAQAADMGVQLADLHTLLKTADVISLHAPVIPETKAMIGARELSMIRDGALLINTARAWLLDNDAFRAEMKKGRFRAYLDVFEPEPPTEDDILRTLDNVVLTPHVAGTTQLMFHRCGRFAIEAIRDYLSAK